MTSRRFSSWFVVLIAAAIGLAGCEPYMSMTDQIPAQTRRATTLLPQSPRFVGMVDLETAIAEIEKMTDVNVLDSLRKTEPGHVREFLDATGIDPATDLKAIYGALGDGKTFSAVVFANVTPDQMDRYLNEASGDVGRATSYRDVPVYHLTGDADESHDEERDALSLAFMGNGMIAAAKGSGRIEAMVDRYRETAPSFSENKEYMTLVKKVGRGSTAWLAGRDVLESALRDSADGATVASSKESASVNSAGFERALSQWSDRVLGLSDASSTLDGRTGGKLRDLKSRIREQAVSLTLTEKTLDGEVYLTMSDPESATNVVDIARGGIAALKLSNADLSKRHQDLLDEIDIERSGPIVRVTFSIGREHLDQFRETALDRSCTRQANTAARREDATVRRLTGINRDALSFGFAERSKTKCNLLVDGPVLCSAREGESGRTSS